MWCIMWAGKAGVAVAFNEWLSDKLKTSGLTKQEVAGRVGVKQGYISRLRSGDATNPSPELLQKLAHLFGTSVDEAYAAAGILDPPIDDLQALRRPDPELRELLEAWPDAPPVLRR